MNIEKEDLITLKCKGFEIFYVKYIGKNHIVCEDGLGENEYWINKSNIRENLSNKKEA